MNPTGSYDSHIVRLITAAAHQNSLTGLTEVLKVVAEATGSAACIFWEKSETGRLFVLASSLPWGWTPAAHYLDETSQTAHAMRSGETFQLDVNDLRGNPSFGFLFRNGIRRLATTPFRLNSGAQAALNIYRTRTEPYTPETLEHLKQLALVLPMVYTNLIDRFGFQLLSRTHLLENADDDPPRQFDALIRAVAGMFNCMEASVFLEDRFEDPGVYRLLACHWQWPDEKPLTGYAGHALPPVGATRYAVEHRTKVHALDLADGQELKRQYPDLEWKDSWRIREKVKRALPLGPNGEIQPITFVAVPVIASDRVVGVIRCCTARSAPYYFDPRCVQFLEVVAERAGSRWEAYLARRQDSREVELWRRLVDKVAGMNSYAIEELDRPLPQERKIFRQALELIKGVFIDAFAFAVRLKDPETNELFFAETEGEIWKTHRSRQNLRYPLTNPIDSAGAWVWHNKDVFISEDSKNDDVTRPVFQETTREIVAPITAGDSLYGVLDINSSSKRPFSPESEHVARLLGKQLGLYHHLALKIQQVRKFEDQNRQRVERERKTYENFEHQIRTPVMMAHRRAEELVKDYGARRQLDPKLLVARSWCRQADRVSRNLRFFAQLSEERPITLLPDSLTTLTVPALLAFLKEAAEDQARQVRSKKHIEFQVDDKSFEDLAQITVQADWELLQQAVGNLLDNAGKYSYANTRVRVSGGLARQKEYFYIAVTNRGLKLEEISKLAERGHRGNKASKMEGSGIGLWIVKHIMIAHKGMLEIIPTTSQDVNEFRLLFPKLKTAGT